MPVVQGVLIGAGGKRNRPNDMQQINHSRALKFLHKERIKTKSGRVNFGSVGANMRDNALGCARSRP